MDINIEQNEVILVLGLMEHADPTGFFCGTLHEKIRKQLIEEQKRLQKEPKDLKENKETKE